MPSALFVIGFFITRRISMYPSQASFESQSGNSVVIEETFFHFKT
jgi:hypothetical protein